MFNIIRQRIRRVAGREPNVARPHDATVQLHVPSPYGGAPWLTATFALTSTPRGQGETVRLRAHIDGRVRLPQPGNPHSRLGYQDGGAGRRGLVRYSRDTAAAVARGVIRRLPADRLESFAARRWRSWVDVQLSTAPLDRGAEALMPEPLRDVYGAGLPSARAGEPRVGVWSGPAGGAAGGVASLALLQLDERDFGRRSRDPNAGGFSLNASVAQVIEPNLPYDDGD